MMLRFTIAYQGTVYMIFGYFKLDIADHAAQENHGPYSQKWTNFSPGLNLD